MVKYYGEYWNPDTIEWGQRGRGNSGRFTGKIASGAFKNRHADFWRTNGIYVLQKEFRTIYVGKADSEPLGKRVRDHLDDRFIGRWDMFSWFSFVDMIDNNGTLEPDPNPQWNNPDIKQLCNVFEAVVIQVTDPPLNRQHPHVAHKVLQVGGSVRTIRSYLENIVQNAVQPAPTAAQPLNTNPVQP